MDVILRIVTVTLLMVMALGVIAKPRPWRWAICFVAVAIGTSAFVTTNSTGEIIAPTQWSGWSVLVNFLNKTIVISVWLFVQSSFDDQFRFDKFRVGVSLAWLAIILKDIWLWETGRDDPLGFATTIFALALMAHLIWTLLRDRDGDLRLGRRTARIWLSAAMVGLLLMDIIIDITMGFAWRPDGFIYAQNSLILMFVLAFAAATLKLDISKIAPKPPTSNEEHQPLSNHAVTLKRLMREEQLYLRPELRLSDLVARLPISEAATRQLIHDEFGQGHFRSFLNQYRIKHAQELIRAPEHQTSKLIAIAFDSGFASLASFQRAFKRETGQTASEWRAKKD